MGHNKSRQINTSPRGSPAGVYNLSSVGPNPFNRASTTLLRQTRGSESPEIESKTIASRMLAFELKMKRAADKKQEKQRQRQQSAHNSLSKVSSTVSRRKKLLEDTYQTQFEKNVLKRTEQEKRQKKRAQEKRIDLEYTKSERVEKERALKKRLE